jgi:ankyrin repeat protein
MKNMTKTIRVILCSIFLTGLALSGFSSLSFAAPKFAATKKAVTKSNDKANEVKPVLTLKKLNALEESVVAGNLERAKELCKKKDLLNPSDAGQGFPLIFAIYQDNIPMLDLLLECGANVNEKLKNGVSALYMAVTLNHIGQAVSLLKYKADVNATVNGASAVEVAVNFGYFGMYNLLLQNGASKWVPIEERAKKIAEAKEKENAAIKSEKKENLTAPIPTKVNIKPRTKAKAPRR